MFRTLGNYEIRDLSLEEGADQEVGPGDFFGVTAGDFPSVWHFDGTSARRVGVVGFEPLSVTGAVRDAVSAVPLHVGPKAQLPRTIHRMQLPPGAYYPRIARPNDQNPLETPGDNPDWKGTTEARVGSLGQIRLLMSMLETVFQSVHPAAPNLTCYGNAVRNLLILASTECEAQWRGILTANSYPFKGRPSTNDFVKLRRAMRLDEYEVRLPLYPALGPIAPFRDWVSASPTESLHWYASYNAVKHDRESQFDRATLGAAINAVVACWIMLAGQFGWHAMREFYDLRDYFKLSKAPRWRFSEVYTYGYDDFNEFAGPQNYPF